MSSTPSSTSEPPQVASTSRAVRPLRVIALAGRPSASVPAPSSKGSEDASASGAAEAAEEEAAAAEEAEAAAEEAEEEEEEEAAAEEESRRQRADFAGRRGRAGQAEVVDAGR